MSRSTWFAESASECTPSASMDADPEKKAAMNLVTAIPRLAPRAARMARVPPDALMLSFWSNRSRHRGREGVAPGGAVLITAEEPLLPLLAGAVGPRLRVGVRALDAVVADGGRGAQRVPDLGVGDLLEQRRSRRVVRPGGGRGPRPGVAVGLQLGPHASGRRPGLSVLRLLQHAGQVLDVVAPLVRDDVELGERSAGRAVLVAEVGVEAGVEVDGRVVRAVE